MLPTGSPQHEDFCRLIKMSGGNERAQLGANQGQSRGSAELPTRVSCGLFGLNCCVQAAESSGHQDPPPSDASLSIVSRSRTPPKYFAKAYSKTDGAFGTDENNVMHE
jgi:hypothetical protein